LTKENVVITNHENIFLQLKNKAKRTRSLCEAFMLHVYMMIISYTFLFFLYYIILYFILFVLLILITLYFHFLFAVMHNIFCYAYYLYATGSSWLYFRWSISYCLCLL